jgi:cellulose synthase operon protein C
MIVRVIRHPRAQRLLSAVAVAAAFLLPVLAPHAAQAQTVTPAARASQFYEDALQRFEKKDYAGAVVQLKNVLRLDARNLSAQVLLGRALLEEGQANAAEVALDEALRLGVSRDEVIVPLAQSLVAQGRLAELVDPSKFADAGLPDRTRARLLMLKAAASSDLGRPRDALRLLDQARSLDSASAESWIAEVPIRVRARQFAEARAAADKALSIDPVSAAALYQRASVAHVAGELDAAIGYYTRTLQAKPDHVDALVARAGLYLDTQQFEKAGADATAARKSDPRDPRSAYLSAMIAERTGQAKAARDALTEVTNLLDPLPLDYIRFRPQILMLGGMSHYALDQFEKAKPYLEAVLRQDAGSPVAKLLSNIHVREGRHDLAVNVLEAYQRSQPGDRQALKLLASSNLSLGRHAKARQLAEAGLKDEDDPALRAVLGMSLVHSGQAEQGARELEAALRKQPAHLPAAIMLTNLYMASGQATKAVASATSLTRQHPSHPGAFNLLGSAQLANGQEAAAREAFNRALALDANHVEAQLNLVRMDVNAARYDEASRRLAPVLTRDPKNVDAMMESARMMHRRGRQDEAVQWLKRAVDADSRRLEPGLQLVDYGLEIGRPELAREALDSLRNRAPEALLVQLAGARVQLASGQLAEARATLGRAATAVAFDAAALVQIADLQVRAGHAAGAAHSLDKALSTRPSHLRARVMRSNVYLLQNDPAKAEQLARSVLASDPASGIGDSLLGDVARHRGQTAAAIDAYRRAHQRQASTQSFLALFSAQETSQRAAALQLAERWLSQHPGDALAWRALGDSHARRADWPAALKAYEKLQALLPDDAEVLNNFAFILVNNKDGRALGVAERALALRPQSASIIGTAGWAAHHAGRPEQALQRLRDARLRDPSNGSTRFFLATVLAAQGRQQEARSELQAALQSGRDFPHASEAAALLRTLN